MDLHILPVASYKFLTEQYIKNLDKYVGATVEIFNRYGAKVFHAEGNYKPRDGKLGSQNLPVGTYFYFINPHNGHKVISGSIAIIR